MSDAEPRMPPADSLWTYARALYARPGVEAACLTLQDRAGVDVPFLLFAAWLGAARGVALDDAQVVRLHERLGGWQDQVVRPLRDVRRRLKMRPDLPPGVGAEMLREKVKAVELDAERLEIETLAALAHDIGGGGQGSPALATANMAVVISATAALGASAAAELDVLRGAVEALAEET